MTKNIFCLSIIFKFIFNWNIITLQCCINFIVQQCEPSMCIQIFSPLFSLPPTPSHASRLSQSTQLSSLWYVTTFDQLAILHMVVYTCQCCSLNLAHFLLPLLCPQSALYVFVSIPALQTGSPVPFFQFPYIHINTQYLFFSTSFCMTDSRFIHISMNDPVLFLYMTSMPLYILTHVTRDACWCFQEPINRPSWKSNSSLPHPFPSPAPVSCSSASLAPAATGSTFFHSNVQGQLGKE